MQEVNYPLIQTNAFNWIYDHFYDDSIWENTNITTHYIIEAILIPIGDNTKKFKFDSQHSEFLWINESNIDTTNV